MCYLSCSRMTNGYLSLRFVEPQEKRYSVWFRCCRVRGRNEKETNWKRDAHDPMGEKYRRRTGCVHFFAWVHISNIQWLRIEQKKKKLVQGRGRRRREWEPRANKRVCTCGWGIAARDTGQGGPVRPRPPWTTCPGAGLACAQTTSPCARCRRWFSGRWRGSAGSWAPWPWPSCWRPSWLSTTPPSARKSAKQRPWCHQDFCLLVSTSFGHEHQSWVTSHKSQNTR